MRGRGAINWCYQGRNRSCPYIVLAFDDANLHITNLNIRPRMLSHYQISATLRHPYHYTVFNCQPLLVILLVANTRMPRTGQCQI